MFKMNACYQPSIEFWMILFRMRNKNRMLLEPIDNLLLVVHQNSKCFAFLCLYRAIKEMWIIHRECLFVWKSIFASLDSQKSVLAFSALACLFAMPMGEWKFAKFWCVYTIYMYIYTVLGMTQHIGKNIKSLASWQILTDALWPVLEGMVYTILTHSILTAELISKK